MRKEENTIYYILDLIPLPLENYPIILDILSLSYAAIYNIEIILFVRFLIDTFVITTRDRHEFIRRTTEIFHYIQFAQKLTVDFSEVTEEMSKDSDMNLWNIVSLKFALNCKLFLVSLIPLHSIPFILM